MKSKFFFVFSFALLAASTWVEFFRIAALKTEPIPGALLFVGAVLSTFVLLLFAFFRGKLPVSGPKLKSAVVSLLIADALYIAVLLSNTR